jgi:hypothetical protein
LFLLGDKNCLKSRYRVCKQVGDKKCPGLDISYMNCTFFCVPDTSNLNFIGYVEIYNIFYCLDIDITTEIDTSQAKNFVLNKKITLSTLISLLSITTLILITIIIIRKCIMPKKSKYIFILYKIDWKIYLCFV